MIRTVTRLKNNKITQKKDKNTIKQYKTNSLYTS